MNIPAHQTRWRELGGRVSEMVENIGSTVSCQKTLNLRHSETENANRSKVTLSKLMTLMAMLCSRVQWLKANSIRILLSLCKDTFGMRELYSHNRSPCITKLEFFHPCFQGHFEAESQQTPHYLLSKHHWLARWQHRCAAIERPLS